MRRDASSLLVAFLVMIIRSAKQDADAPKAGKTNERIDNTAQNRVLTAKDPSHQIELREAYKTPVDGADGCENQGDGIQINPSLLPKLIVVCAESKKLFCF